MGRSIKKGPFVEGKLLKRIMLAKGSSEKIVIKTWSRASMILPDMISLTIAIHDGRRHVPIFITEGMVGHKLGEFSHTRLFRGHTNKKEGIKS